MLDATQSDLQQISLIFDRNRFWRRLANALASLVFLLCAGLVLWPLASIVSDLVIKGASSINIEFFTHLPKPVGESGGGMANAVVGSIVLLVIALCVGAPIGMAVGIYLSEYSSGRFSKCIRFIVDVMNGIPSIVFGIFTYTLLVVPMKSFSVLAGGVALGLMMIPIVTRTTEQFIAMVPSSLREAAIALGLPKWRVTLGIVVEAARGGIVTGVMVALARVAGETAPLLFTAFGNRYWHSGLFEPIAALPIQIFSYAISPFEEWHRQAWAGALVLMGMVFSINFAASTFLANKKRKH